MHNINWSKFKKKEKKQTVLDSKIKFDELPLDLQKKLKEMDFTKSLRENVKIISEDIGIADMPNEEKVLIEDMFSVAMVIKVISLETILTNIEYDKEDAGLPYNEMAYKKAFESFEYGLDVSAIELLKLVKDSFKSNYTLEDVWK